VPLPSPRNCLRALLVLLVALRVPAARAQETATARAGVEPPALEHDPGVSYPAQAGEAGLRERIMVVLVLQVGRDGLVHHASVEAPGRPEFDEQALAAARQLRFKPARRDGLAVAAKIRFRYVFEPPELPAALPAGAAQPKPAPPPAIPSADPTTITVLGEPAAPAVKTLSRADVRQMPGAFGDPFRAIEALPGVTPIASGLPFFYVRGAPPGNVGYFLDGMRVPLLYHVAIGPAVIHPGLTERVDLYSGGYPARFGRYAGGIVSAELARPRSDTHGEANLRLFDAGALVESGFGGGRGTALLASRYSYTALLFSALVPDLQLDYRDYQARFTYDLTDRDRVTFLGLGSYDLLAQEQPGGLNVLFGTEFYRAGLRYDHELDSGSLRSDVTVGFDQSLMGDEGRSQARSLALRTEARYRLGRHWLRTGADVSLESYSSETPRYADPDDPEVRNFSHDNPSRTDRTFGLWGDVVLEPAPGLQVTPGIRADLYQSAGEQALAVEPRLAARLRVRKRLTITHAYGLVHQPPAFVVPLPGRAAAELGSGLQRSLQASSGVELLLGWQTKATATLFYNIFLSMTDGLSAQGEGPPDAGVDERSQGYALGLELNLYRPLSERLGGFLSYTLSRSMRSQGREHYPNAFDRTHVLNLALAYELGRKWRVGGRIVFYTGTPEEPEADDLVAPPRSRSPSRSDPFFRLDVRLEKRWDLSEHTWLAFVTEIMNATLSQETFGDEAIGPITIPSIGLEAGF
jgi:TonB family protein